MIGFWKKKKAWEFSQEVLEEGEESGCCVEFTRGAPDEGGAAEFPEQSRKGREAHRRYQRTDPPNHEVNMILT